MAVVTITYESVKRSIIDLVADTVVEADLYEPELRGLQTTATTLLDAVTAAITASCTRVWKQCELDIAAGATSIVLPTNLIEVEGVRDLSTNKLLPNLPLKIGSVFEAGWSTFPYGNLTFSTAIGTKGAKLYYSGIWNIPVEDIYGVIDNFVCDFPFSLRSSIVYYGAFYVMLQKASQSAIIRQFGTKVDSGDPLDNPLLQQAKAFHNQFEIELKRLPATQKGVVY